MKDYIGEIFLYTNPITAYSSSIKKVPSDYSKQEVLYFTRFCIANSFPFCSLSRLSGFSVFQI